MKIIDSNTLFGFWPKRNLDASAETLLERMKESSISRALSVSTRGILYDFREGNDETRITCSESNQRLIPVATINPSRYFGVSEEVDRIIEMGFRIVRFFPEPQEWKISQRHFTKLLEKVSETRLIVMLPSTEGVTTIANTIAGIDNKVIIETIRAYPNLAELIIVLQENPNLYVETHLINSTDFIEVLISEVGQNRIIFGSGAPIHSFGSAILPVTNANTSAEAKEKILSGNILDLIEAAV